ncbi:anti-sigma factor domain-containing protein [Sporolactobacillus shoreicorticis]|uniref:Anti-sigma factor domain-containing protein n=1 Tax=Sporolactobacillus shoreicorticis TaxID=1923877 RepID=A0ABW5S907_9BACL|nr:anti-sigma factor domain-containing protein [Sporolactobacillus shoreicorticis]MCO7127304.1 anti-sigma factor domain-containing protein [Sporolactobacillus shoreicorticis]
MSKKGRRAVILTDEGDFKSVRLRRTVDLSIGQTVRCKHLAQFHLLPKSILTPMVALGFSLLCFIPLSHSTYAPPGPVAAYVYFDLKASIEASVDRNMQVISVQPLNSEARQLLKVTPVVQKMPLQQFSSALFSKLKNKGASNKQSLCLVTTVLTNQISRSQKSVFTQRLTASFNSGARQVLQANGGGIEWLQASLERKKDAEARGLSVGKYLLYLQANAYGKTLSLEDAKQLSIEKMREVSGAVSLPWHSLIRERINSTTSGSGSHIEQASFRIKQFKPLFQNPFQVGEVNKNRESSSYNYLNTRTAGYA